MEEKRFLTQWFLSQRNLRLYSTWYNEIPIWLASGCYHIAKAWLKHRKMSSSNFKDNLWAFFYYKQGIDLLKNNYIDF